MQNIPHDPKSALLAAHTGGHVLVVGIPQGITSHAVHEALQAAEISRRFVVTYESLLEPGPRLHTERTLSTDEAAQALDCTPKNIRRLAAAGRFPAIKEGRDWRTAIEDIDLLRRFQLWPFPAGRPKQHQEPDQ